MSIKTFFLLIPGLLISISGLHGQVIDTLDFETPDTAIVINPNQTNNSWQIGQPTKAYFDSAYSGQRAILTDTLNPYPANDTSSFTLFFDIYGGRPTVSFYHRMHSDLGNDGGYVELSLDQGQSWIMLNDTTYRMILNQLMYGLEVWNFYTSTDSISKGAIGFSGTDSGWVNTQVIFPCMAIKTAWALQLRFTFISDSIPDNLDGWMIDQIIIDNSGDCSDLREYSTLPQLTAYPNPVSGNSVVIETGDHYPEYNVAVINSQGNDVRKLKSEGGAALRVNTEGLSPGLYLMLVESRGKAIGIAKALIK